MKIAHLIIVHTEPKQVEQLVQKMLHEDSYFYIHVNSKVDDSGFGYLEKLPNTKLTKARVAINWAGFSFTIALIECIREILLSDIKYDFINLMSGQDYPIKTNEYIHAYLAANVGKSFFAFEEYGTQWWKAEEYRIEKYNLADFVFKGSYYVQEFINYIMPKRKFPLPYALYGGNCAAWWTMSVECAAYIVNFMDSNKRLKRFAKFTWGVDEFLLPTIVMNSPLKDKIINDNLRYIDWSLGGWNPKVLISEDFEKLKKSDKLLARKFHVHTSAMLLAEVNKLTG
ncbi:MAG: glycosyltransferase [Hymenobacter sp.]|nr:MAG: glycosyltransferase [Hymenobacter sp.]